jgi:hypothetical protein
MSRASSFSRGIASEFCICSLSKRGKRSADRRSGAAAPVARACARRRETSRLTSHDAGRPPLGAPPRLLGRRTVFRLWTGIICEPCLRGFPSLALPRLTIKVASRSGGGQRPEAPGRWLRAKRAGTASRAALVRLRRRPRCAERQDDMPRQTAVKGFQRCAQRNGGHAVHSKACHAAEMRAQQRFPTKSSDAQKTSRPWMAKRSRRRRTAAQSCGAHREPGCSLSVRLAWPR